uniref:Uncharacterized protein n=1 Tax=Tanacetum cinerariifolium TaxID=118510 RepID=A0A699JXK5_TANCI|nr:hypothetical protein [Tanacetum cinerariifolium]
MQRVGKGFSGVETSLFESMLAVSDVAEKAEAQVPGQGDDVQEHAAKEVATNAVPPTPTSPSPSSPVGTSQRVESSDDVENVFNQGRMIVDMDQDQGIEQVTDQEKDAEVEGRHADKQAEIYNIDFDHSLKVLSMQEDDTEVQEAVEIVTTANLMTEVVTATATQVAAATKTPKVKDKGKGILIEAPKPMKKKDQIEMDAEYARKLQEEINKEHEEAYKNIDWNADLDHVQSKEPKYIKRYHGMKKKPQTESEARKNMIFYLKNTEGYKLDFFKEKTYDEILPTFQAKFDVNMKFLFKLREEMEKEDEEIIKSINETPTQKAAKKRKLSEEAQEADDLRKRLEIIQYEDDDVFVEATPLAQKVPVVDYLIVVIDNKPKYTLSIFTLEQLVNVARLQVEEESEMSLGLLREEDAEEEVHVPTHDDVDQENVVEETADDLERLHKIKSSKLRRLKKFGTSQHIESSEDKENVFNQGGKSVNINEGIELVDDQQKDVQVKGRQADTQSEIYNIDLDHTSKVIPAADPVVAAVSIPISAAKPKGLKAVPAAPTVSIRKRKGVVIRDPEEELHDHTPAETQ